MSNTQSLTGTNRELILQLLDDVSVIQTTFATGTPRPSAARTVFVPILRRWIAEGLFYRAQKLILPNKPLFEICSERQSVQLCKSGVYDHWMGFTVFEGIGVSTSQLAKKHLLLDGRPNIDLSGAGPTKPLPQRAKIFFEQRIFFWKGEFYTRVDVIKMHANLLGGIHFDFPEKDSEEHILEIKNRLGFELHGNNRQMLVGDDVERARADLSRRDYTYDATELVAIDTARIFANGASGVRAQFRAVLD